MSVLPKNYKMQKSEGGLFTKLSEGDTKLRILSEAVVGYEWWEGKDPKRCRDLDEIPDGVGQAGDSGWREFWTFKIYNFTEDTVQIMVIKQQTIKTALFSLDNSKDWGDLREYNITINRKGQKKDTEYNVIPSPKSDLAKEILDKTEKVKIDWSKFMKSENPFVFDKNTKEDVKPDDIPF